MRATLRPDLTAAAIVLGCVAAVLAVTAVVRVAASVVPLSAVPWPAAIGRDDMVQARYRTVGAPEGRWALVVDGSAADRAFDTETVGMPCTKQVLAGGVASDVAFIVSWTLRALPPARRPAVVVWGVLPACLSERGEISDPLLTEIALARPDATIAARLGAFPPGPYAAATDAAERAVHRIDPWLGPRETVADAAACGLRALLFGGDGIEAAPRWTWRPWEEFDADDRARQRTRMIRQWSARGALGDDPIAPVQAAACEEVIRVCREAGAPLHVIHLAEHSELRAATSAVGRARIVRFFEERGVPSLDLHDRIPDDLFHDAAHVEPAGRVVTTSLLAEYLARVVR